MHVRVLGAVPLVGRCEEEAGGAAGDFGEAVLDEAIEPATLFEVREGDQVGFVVDEFALLAAQGGVIGEPVADRGVVARGGAFIRGERLDAFDDVDCVRGC